MNFYKNYDNDTKKYIINSLAAQINVLTHIKNHAQNPVDVLYLLDNIKEEVINIKHIIEIKEEL